MPTPALPSPRPSPVALRVLIGVVSAVGFAIIGLAVAALPATPHPLGWISVGVLALVAGSFALKVPGVPVYLSISDTFFITSVLLFGPAPATVAIALDSLVMSLRRRNALHQILFNTTSNALSLWAAGEVFFALAGTGPLVNMTSPPGPALMLPLVCLAALYFLLNSGLVATAVAWQKGGSATAIWREHFAVVSLNHFGAASASFFLIVLTRSVTPVAIGAVLPLLVILYLAMRSWLGRLDDAQRHIAKVNRLYLSTVSALSTAIEAKDGVTSDHIHRVQAYASGLARALSLTDPATLQAIEAAALLHDTGKLAIPEHILNKPGRLTPVEFETMKSHVDVGGDILSSVDFPYPVVPIVRAHHENWDGTGYPRGLRGEDIPIGARILSVVDCFDALTSDRPYRPAMSESAALEIIVERRGTMYDPAVVDTFTRVYRDIFVPAPRPQLQEAVRHIRQAAVATADESVGTRTTTGVCVTPETSEDLLAFVSLARLTAGSPALGDVGALAWSHLRHLVPGATTLALFTLDATRAKVVAQYAAGPHASRVAGLGFGVGQRLTGWVAAHARTIVNSEAQLDLGSELENGPRFALAVPLVAAGAVVGVLTLYALELFADDQARTLEMIAPHLATAVAATSSLGVEAPPLARPSDRPRRSASALRVVARNAG